MEWQMPATCWLIVAVAVVVVCSLYVYMYMCACLPFSSPPPPPPLLRDNDTGLPPPPAHVAQPLAPGRSVGQRRRGGKGRAVPPVDGCVLFFSAAWRVCCVCVKKGTLVSPVLGLTYTPYVHVLAVMEHAPGVDEAPCCHQVVLKEASQTMLTWMDERMNARDGWMRAPSPLSLSLTHPPPQGQTLLLPACWAHASLTTSPLGAAVVSAPFVHAYGGALPVGRVCCVCVCHPS